MDNVGRISLQRAALIYGACHQCEEVADFLIAKGMAIDIFTASTFCLLDVVNQELKRKPDLVSARCQGSTPLNRAVRPRKRFSDAPDICSKLHARRRELRPSTTLLIQGDLEPEERSEIKFCRQIVRLYDFA